MDYYFLVHNFPIAICKSVSFVYNKMLLIFINVYNVVSSKVQAKILKWLRQISRLKFIYNFLNVYEVKI